MSFQPFITLLSVKITPPWMYVIIITMGGAGLSLLTQSTMQGRQELGYDPASPRTRLFARLLAFWLILSAVDVIWESSMSLRVLCLSFIAFLFYGNNLLEYLAKSRRHAERNAAMVRQAEAALKVKGKI